MSAYLVIDVDDLLSRFTERSINIDLQELAVGFAVAQVLASGLVNAEDLKRPLRLPTGQHMTIRAQPPPT